MERDLVQLAHAALLILFREFPKIADLPTNFSPWWKNKMAGDWNILSKSMVEMHLTQWRNQGVILGTYYIAVTHGVLWSALQ